MTQWCIIVYSLYMGMVVLLKMQKRVSGSAQDSGYVGGKLVYNLLVRSRLFDLCSATFEHSPTVGSSSWLHTLEWSSSPEIWAEI
jgi:hypothetical protein